MCVLWIYVHGKCPSILNKTMVRCEHVFRLAIHQDLDAIHQLNQDSFSEAWSRQAFEEAWLHDYDMVLCMSHKDDLLGYYLAQSIDNESEIMQLSVSPSWRKKGVALALMRYAMTLKSHQTFFLEVRASNQAAIALYQKLDFQIVARRKKYYKARLNAEREDALIMSYERSK